MKGYSWSKEDFRELLYAKYNQMPIKATLRDFLFKSRKNMETYTRENPGCLTLSEDMMDERDFKAEEVIKLDLTKELPESFSLGEWVYSTNYQNGWGSCTANATSHGVQVLNVKGEGKKPTENNIITPNWRNLWINMGHDITDKNDSGDYVEKAINTALKLGIETEEGGVAKFDGYSYDSRTGDTAGIEKIKRYIYNGNPVDWCLRGNKTTRNELTKGEMKTFIEAKDRTGGHAVCCVGWDKGGLWFLNSWNTNDGKGLKSRFYISNKKLIECAGMLNRRYRPLFKKEQVVVDTEYLKRKNNYVLILKSLKNLYTQESSEMQKAIEQFSQKCRKNYPEIDTDLPIK